MFGTGKFFPASRSFLCLAVLFLGGIGTLAALSGSRNKSSLPADLDHWDLPRLLHHLDGQGLGLREVPVSEAGPFGLNIFLTKTDKSWEQLNDLTKVRERVDQWRGTVYCERVSNLECYAEQIPLWGDCYLVAGRFVFFGDPELLAQIRDALRRSEVG
jgi:hypothetical protein